MLRILWKTIRKASSSVRMIMKLAEKTQKWINKVEYKTKCYLLSVRLLGRIELGTFRLYFGIWGRTYPVLKESYP